MKLVLFGPDYQLLFLSAGNSARMIYSFILFIVMYMEFYGTWRFFLGGRNYFSVFGFIGDHMTFYGQ